MGETNQNENLGQYRLEGCIAEGNLARICQAVDRTNGRRVIVRVLDPLACRNEMLRTSLNAMRDPQHPRRTQDPHFLQVLEVGMKGDSYYVVKEYFDSLPLDRHLAQQNPPLQEKVRLARLMLECLRAVHGHRMAHGDVKPQNILVGRDRNGKQSVKIALSDLATSSSQGLVSICGELLATPKYLAPEQVRGKAATDASDLFAMGVVLYEMFTGREPFPSDSPLAYLHGNLHGRLIPADEVNPQLPHELARMLARLLEREVDDRYRHAQSVLDDLDRIESAMNGVTPQPVDAGSDSAFAPVAAARVRPDSFWKPIAIAALAAACFLLVAGIILLSAQLADVRRKAAGKASWGLPPADISQQGGGPVIQPSAGTQTPVAPASQADLLQKSVSDLRARVETLVKAGQYDDALDALSQFTSDPKHAPLSPLLNEVTASVMALKAAELAKADPGASIALFRKVMKDYPTTGAAKTAAEPAAAVMVAAAIAMDGDGKVAAAVATLEQARKEYPGTSGAARAAGLLPGMELKLAQSLVAAEPDRAVDMMKALLNAKLSDDDMAALKRSLGPMLLKRLNREITGGKYAEAVEDIRTLRGMGAADPTMRGTILAKEPEALAGLALQLKAQGKAKEAAEVWNDLKTRYPGAYALKEHGDEIAPALDAAAPQSPPAAETAPALLEAAKAALKAGDTSAAAEKLEKLTRDFAATPEAAEAAGMLASKKFGEAVQLLGSNRKAEANALLEKVAADYPRTSAAAQASALLDRIQDTPKGMVYVPASEFTLGLSPERLADIVKRFNVPGFMVKRWFEMQTPDRRVDLKGFYIDEREVTNGEYHAYVKATGAAAPALMAADDKGADFDSLPVVGVSFEEASAYAAWAGKRLPTEEEWEKAARGTDGRLFPWGDEFDAKCCVVALSGAKGPEPVGICPSGASPYGVLDMIGNVAEWTTSPFAAYQGAAGMPVAADETLKVVRGAAWDELSKEFCAATMRAGVNPAKRSYTIGFRCVKDAD